LVVLLGVAGLLALIAAVLPRVLRDRPLSLPMTLLVAGTMLGMLPLPPPYGSGVLDPRHHLQGVEMFTQLTALVALAGAGLKADRALGWKSWNSAWRLLAFALPLSVAAVALLGWWALGLVPATALLLGAALSPTDPVLAGDVQVPTPDAADERGPDNEIRFTLTAEAGLNDGLAMPFVALAVVLVHTADTVELGLELGRQLLSGALGCVVGVACGKLLGWLMFRVRHEQVRLGEHSDGVVVLVIAFLPYAVSELVGGIGFVSVFLAAVVVRASERSHGYHNVLHHFGDQLERFLVAVALLALGVAIGDSLLTGLTWQEIAVAVTVVLVIRPLVGWLSLVGAPARRPAMAAVAFFGVRGIGTLYYVAFALSQTRFPGQDSLWRVAAVAVALSVLVHGTLSGPVMGWLERRGDQARLPRRC
jgi:NhaP-type Na+/H+ or K+/H+ antiporter